MSPQETTAAPELAALMQPFMASPVITPPMMEAILKWMQGEFAKLAERAEDGAAVRQEWGTASEVAKIYGKHRVTMAKHLAAWAAAGKVQVRQIFDEVTRAYGNKMYNLADVDRLLAETAAESTAKESAAKEGAA